MQSKREYTYKGAVLVNGKANDRDYRCTTMAVSEAAARNNIIHNYKEYANLPYNVKVELVSDLQCEKTYVFNGNVLLNGRIVRVEYRDVVDAYDETQALARLTNRYRDRQFLSSSVLIEFSGDLSVKEE